MDVPFLGLTLHEFDVGITDVILCIFSSYFLYKLLQIKAQKEAVLIFLGLTGSSLCGALFHFFFPLKAETAAGFFMWSVTVLSIGLVIFGMITYMLKSFSVKPFLRKSFSFMYLISFALWFFLINHTYSAVILFYAPAVLSLGILSLYFVFKRKYVYMYLLVAVLLSFLAAYIQVSKISIHPTYFNFNSLYHVVQLLGIFCMFLFFIKTKHV